MSTREIPSPMPPTLRDTVNMTLADRGMWMLDSNTRFIMRRMVADAYALGFNDGRIDHSQCASYDEQIESDKAKEGGV